MNRRRAAAIACFLVVAGGTAQAGAQSDEPPELRAASESEVVYADEEPLVLDDNGAWSWFEDERALLADCTLWAGTVGNGSGPGGAAENGAVDVIARDLSTGTTDH